MEMEHFVSRTKPLNALLDAYLRARKAERVAPLGDEAEIYQIGHRFEVYRTHDKNTGENTWDAPWLIVCECGYVQKISTIEKVRETILNHQSYHFHEEGVPL